MRRIVRITILASLLAFTSGCMVLDEVDAANAKMKKMERKKPETAATTPSATPSSGGVLESTKQWWKSASSLTPAEMDSGIVQCRVDGGTQYMSRDDCLSRGGRPQSTSG